MTTRKPWMNDAPCDNCGIAARRHHEDGCANYFPIICQADDDHHGGPVRVRKDDAELCQRHEQVRQMAE